jgi:hypothetical protein
LATAASLAFFLLYVPDSIQGTGSAKRLHVWSNLSSSATAASLAFFLLYVPDQWER